uniref:Uncharacterized protein n=1 Tax=Cannabis sativa TaxID=3483 RepID=A0A803QCT4_CANSA
MLRNRVGDPVLKFISLRIIRIRILKARHKGPSAQVSIWPGLLVLQVASTEIPRKEVDYERKSKRTETQKRGSIGSPPDTEKSPVKKTSYERASKRTQTRDRRLIGLPHVGYRTNRNFVQINSNNVGNRSPPSDSLHNPHDSKPPCDPAKGTGHGVRLRGRPWKRYYKSEEYEFRRLKINELLHTRKYFRDEQRA